jgi:hypothetical protein
LHQENGQPNVARNLRENRRFPVSRSQGKEWDKSLALINLMSCYEVMVSINRKGKEKVKETPWANLKGKKGLEFLFVKYKRKGDGK